MRFSSEHQYKYTRIREEENELLQAPPSPAGTTGRVGFERIFDFIPSISVYQISLVCLAMYPRFAAGAIQFGKIVLEARGQHKSLRCKRVSI